MKVHSRHELAVLYSLTARGQPLAVTLFACGPMEVARLLNVSGPCNLTTQCHATHVNSLGIVRERKRATSGGTNAEGVVDVELLFDLGMVIKLVWLGSLSWPLPDSLPGVVFLFTPLIQ